MCVATIGYLNSKGVISPICPGESEKGDLPHTKATGNITVHWANDTCTAVFMDMKVSKIWKGWDEAMSSIRIGQGNMSCSSAIGECNSTFDQVLSFGDVLGDMKEVTSTLVATMIGAPTAGPAARCNWRALGKYPLRPVRYRPETPNTINTPYHQHPTPSLAGGIHMLCSQTTYKSEIGDIIKRKKK